MVQVLNNLLWFAVGYWMCSYKDSPMLEAMVAFLAVVVAYGASMFLLGFFQGAFDHWKTRQAKKKTGP